jgi:hypothetical protein
MSVLRPYLKSNEVAVDCDVLDEWMHKLHRVGLTLSEPQDALSIRDDMHTILSQPRWTEEQSLTVEGDDALDELARHEATVINTTNDGYKATVAEQRIVEYGMEPIIIEPEPTVADDDKDREAIDMSEPVRGLLRFGKLSLDEVALGLSMSVKQARAALWHLIDANEVDITIDRKFEFAGEPTIAVPVTTLRGWKNVVLNVLSAGDQEDEIAAGDKLAELADTLVALLSTNAENGAGTE